MDLPRMIERFLENNEERVRIGGATARTSPRLVFPGSFAPLHAGHREIANCALRKLGTEIDFEISVTNVDKPSLSSATVLSRVQQFDNHAVWLTKAPTFADKAQLFPGATFLLGADTVHRLLDKKYYRDTCHFEQAMKQIVKEGCRFLAFGRLVGKSFATQDAFAIPDILSGRIEFVPESEFRCDISSTEIRRNNAN